MMTYRTRDGDVLDLICRHHYGAQAIWSVEAVLAANPGLAAHGPILASGIVIELPEPDPARAAPDLDKLRPVRLWD